MRAQPLRGGVGRRARRAGGVEGEDSERGEVDLALEGAVAGLAVEELLDEVLAGEVARADAGAAQREDRALEVAGAGDLPHVLAQVVHGGLAVRLHVERVAPGGLEAEHRPAGHLGARGVARRGAESAVGVLGLREPGGRVGGAIAAGRLRRDEERPGDEQRGEGGDRRGAAAAAGRGGDGHGGPRRGVAPDELGSGFEACEHAYERGPRDQRQGEVADCMGNIERDAPRTQRKVAVKRLLPAICRHDGKVQERAVEEARDGAGDRQPDPPQASPSHDREARAADPDEAPARHLPRGPGPLA